MQKARGHGKCRSHRLKAHSFRFYFTPLFTVLFTFPSRYLCTIGLSGVFCLAGWCPRVQGGFHLPPPTQGTGLEKLGMPTGLSPSVVELSKAFDIPC